ncbi:MAG: PEP-CTERM sorting domain-containing protein [Fimbriimonadaceae bacterium]|nr:MAG: PEP-CTERM sorting domain-containing protein [Fimbriimonadaceae bacterium]
MMNLKWNGIKPALVILGLLSVNLAFSASRDLYVSSSGTNSVKRFDGVTGAYLGDFVASGSGGLVDPQGIAFGPDGNLYVASVAVQGSVSSIKKYSGLNGAYMGEFNTGYSFKYAADISWHNGILYAAEFSGFVSPTNGIHRFDATGNHLGLFADTAGGGSDGHMFASDGFFYAVANFPTTAVVKKYNATTGAFISDSANLGGLLLDLREGSNVNFFVNSYSPGAIYQLNRTTGASLGVFATVAPDTQGQIIGLDGSLLIGSYSGNAILRYNEVTGAFLGTFANSGGLLRPNNFTLGPEAVPEPATLTIAGLSLLSLLRKKRSNK